MARTEWNAVPSEPAAPLEIRDSFARNYLACTAANITNDSQLY
ncbi:MAG: hypothetical protein NTX48_00130 [Planctomycetales bacterium]|nr:hypothetical protein [Planctomycetales bacterium]